MKIGFIGTGRMASALAFGIAKSGMDCDLVAFDPSAEAVETLRQQLQTLDRQIELHSSNQQVVESADIVVIAIKPQVLGSVLSGIQSRDANQLFVSVVAGTRIETLAKLLGTPKIVRAMPNTPCLIGMGATALSHISDIPAKDLDIVRSIFESVGQAVTVSEDQMDAVTGLSGSGPAYVYTFIEALIDAAVQTGLPRDVAHSLAVQTVAGATAMVSSSNQHPADLRDQVTSPGGTTLQGLEQLEKLGFRESVAGAVMAATKRSVELSQN